MGRFAFVLPFEFPVALPNNTPIAVCGVPGFGTENIAAVGADDLPGKGTGLAVPGAAVFAPLQLRLHLFPFPRLNDGRVAVLYIILGHFSLVDLCFLGEKIHREGFLQQRRAFVLLVPEDALHGGPLPHGFLARGMTRPCRVIPSETYANSRMRPHARCPDKKPRRL